MRRGRVRACIVAGRRDRRPAPRWGRPAGGARRARDGGGRRAGHRQRGGDDAGRHTAAHPGERVAVRRVPARAPSRDSRRTRRPPGRRPHRARRRALVQDRGAGGACAVAGERAPAGRARGGSGADTRHVSPDRRVLRPPRAAREPLRLEMGRLPGARPRGRGAGRGRVARAVRSRKRRGLRRVAGGIAGRRTGGSRQPHGPRSGRYAARDRGGRGRGGRHARGAGPRGGRAVGAARRAGRPDGARPAGRRAAPGAALSWNPEHQLHPRSRLGARPADRRNGR